jgi:hypothetical protein
LGVDDLVTLELYPPFERLTDERLSIAIVLSLSATAAAAIFGINQITTPDGEYYVQSIGMPNRYLSVWIHNCWVLVCVCVCHATAYYS